MEAAKLQKVEDRLDRGVNGLPSAGDTGAKIPRGTVGAGPMPTPAINSGKKLDSSLLAASNKINNGQGRQYDGAPDYDEDDRPLSASGNGSTGTHASNE